MTRTVYTTPIALGARGVGVGAAGLGLSVVVGSVVVAIGLPGIAEVLLGVVVALVALVSLLVLSVGVARLAGRGTRLVIDDHGFRNATGYGVGPRRVAWRDVRKVQADGDIVSVDLAGDRQSLIKTTAIDVDPRTLARELRSRLNTDRGYRPLR